MRSRRKDRLGSGEETRSPPRTGCSQNGRMPGHGEMMPGFRITTHTIYVTVGSR